MFAGWVVSFAYNCCLVVLCFVWGICLFWVWVAVLCCTFGLNVLLDTIYYGFCFGASCCFVGLLILR